MPKTIDAQSVRMIAAEAACDEQSVRNFVAGKKLRSVTTFRIQNAVTKLGLSYTQPPSSLAVSSVPGSKA